MPRGIRPDSLAPMPVSAADHAAPAVTVAGIATAKGLSFSGVGLIPSRIPAAVVDPAWTILTLGRLLVAQQLGAAA